MAEGVISPEEKVSALNMIAGLNLKVDEDTIAALEEAANQARERAAAGSDGADIDDDEIIEEDEEGNVSRSTTRRSPRPGERTGTNLSDKVRKSLLSDPFSLLELASDYASLAINPDAKHDPEFRKATALMVKNLEEPDRTLFNKMLSKQMMVSTYHDEAGAAELARGAAQLLVEG
jgi:hypothetical protein